MGCIQKQVPVRVRAELLKYVSEQEGVAQNIEVMIFTPVFAILLIDPLRAVVVRLRWHLLL